MLSSCCSGCCRWPWAISAWRCGGGRGRPGDAAAAVTALDALLRWLDLAGIAVFAASGALVASRKRMDAVGFILIAAVTGFGGGTLRDLLLGRTPPFWLRDPTWLAVASSVALAGLLHRATDREPIPRAALGRCGRPRTLCRAGGGDRPAGRGQALGGGAARRRHRHLRRGRARRDLQRDPAAAAQGDLRARRAGRRRGLRRCCGSTASGAIRRCWPAWRWPSASAPWRSCGAGRCRPTGRGPGRDYPDR